MAYTPYHRLFMMSSRPHQNARQPSWNFWCPLCGVYTLSPSVNHDEQATSEWNWQGSHPEAHQIVLASITIISGSHNRRFSPVWWLSSASDSRPWKILKKRCHRSYFHRISIVQFWIRFWQLWQNRQNYQFLMIQFCGKTNCKTDHQDHQLWPPLYNRS